MLFDKGWEEYFELQLQKIGKVTIRHYWTEYHEDCI